MSQSELTKSRLIESAIKIFAKKGFWRTKVSDIVKSAGVAQGTFYLYFKNKEDCLKNILLILHKETINKIEIMVKQNNSLLEIVIFFINRVYQFKEITKVFLFEALSSGDEFKNLYFEFKKNFKNIFAKFIDSKELITIIIGTIHEIIEQDILFEQKSQNEVIDKINKIFEVLKIG